MKKLFKDFLLIAIILVGWLLSGLIFKVDAVYYSYLKLPEFILSNNLISLFWFIIYICNTISIYIMTKKINIFKNYDYLYILITTYLSSSLFMFFFFYLMSPFLGFIICTVTFISSIFWYIETKKISKKSSYFIIPYISYSLYSFIIMTIIYFMNF